MLSAFNPISVFALVSCLALQFGNNIARADGVDGSKIYHARCASCHGVHGEGVSDKYADPLVGDKSIGELTQIIEETMPEDQPGTCAGDEAAAVAQFIFDAFYSPDCAKEETAAAC